MTANAHDQIGRLLALANECLDRQDWDGYIRLFVPTGIIVTASGLVARGRHQLERLLRERPHRARHLNVHLDVAVEGDRAQASSYQLILEPTREPSVLAAGYCVDQLVRQRGAWRFAARRQLLAPMTEGAASLS